jgi:hypothetical protein
MSYRQQGNIAEAKAISKLTQIGYTISIPLTENNSYDLVVEKDRKLKTVQVKSSTNQTSSGGYEVDLTVTYNNNSRMTHKRHEPKSFDLLFVYTPNDDISYLIDEREFTATSSIVVREENKYGKYII